MSGNTFGRLLRFTGTGPSQAETLCGVIDGFLTEIAIGHASFNHKSIISFSVKPSAFRSFNYPIEINPLSDTNSSQHSRIDSGPSAPNFLRHSYPCNRIYCDRLCRGVNELTTILLKDSLLKTFPPFNPLI
ncbi:MAG: hypothetical protein IH598_11975 [Bacteroidales bacterium]|nr:hypothetical protein [Bacteroidales bacterium]